MSSRNKGWPVTSTLSHPSGRWRLYRLIFTLLTLSLVLGMNLAQTRRAWAASGDALADRVLGQPNFTSGVANNPAAPINGLGAASLNLPRYSSVDPRNGRLYIADTANNRVLSWPSATTFGNGQAADRVIGQSNFTSNTPNNPALGGLSAQSLSGPTAVAVDATGSLFVADTGNNRVLQYFSPLVVGPTANRVFGQGGRFDTNAPNNGSPTPNAGGLNEPRGLALDSAGNLYVADNGNNRILIFLTPATTDTIADRAIGQPNLNSGTANNPAAPINGLSAASLSDPKGVTIDFGDTLYVADTGNNRVLAYLTPLTVTPAAGSGDFTADFVYGQSGSFTTGAAGGGPSGLNQPVAAVVEPNRDYLYISDSGNNRVLVFTNPPVSNIAAAVLGQPNLATVTPGTANNKLNAPTGLLVDARGNLVVADTFNNRALGFDIPEPNPVPAVLAFNALSPSFALVGSPDTTLAVFGSNFIPDSQVIWGITPLATTFVNRTKLTAIVPAGNLLTAQTVPVKVRNPLPGGGDSLTTPFEVRNPVPAITNLTPNPVEAAGPAFDLIVSGSGFVSTSVVQWNGANRTTALLSPNALKVAIPATDSAQAGLATIQVVSPGPGGGPSNALTLQVTNPQPTLTSLSPNTKPAGSATFTLTVNGTNFVDNPDPSFRSVVYFGGTALTTTFVSSTQLTATVPAALVATAGKPAVKVSNAQVSGTGGGESSGLPFTVTNVVPAITTLNPNITTAGSPELTLTVTGIGFAPEAIVYWNGSARATSFVNGTTLTATILASDVANGGTASVTVFNPEPGGGTSNALSFAINNPAPTLTALAPGEMFAGSPDFTVELTGTGFVPSSKVRWNGADLGASFVNGTKLIATVPAARVASPGTASVTVFNPAPAGGTSTALPFTVFAPGTTSAPPTVTQVTPSSAPVDSPNATITVTGGNFAPMATVRVNGADVATTYGNATTLVAVVPASALANPGTLQVSVHNPAPSGDSNAVPFTVLPPSSRLPVVYR